MSFNYETVEGGGRGKSEMFTNKLASSASRVEGREAKSKGIKIELSQAKEMIEEEKSPSRKSCEVLLREF